MKKIFILLVILGLFGCENNEQSFQSASSVEQEIQTLQAYIDKLLTEQVNPQIDDIDSLIDKHLSNNTDTFDLARMKIPLKNSEIKLNGYHDILSKTLIEYTEHTLSDTDASKKVKGIAKAVEELVNKNNLQ